MQEGVCYWAKNIVNHGVTILNSMYNTKFSIITPWLKTGENKKMGAFSGKKER